MMGHTTAYREIMREYEYARNEAYHLRERRQQALYENLPRVKEIDREMTGIGLKLAKMALTGKASPAQARADYDALNREKSELLAAKGIPTDYLTDVYRCNRCADTGFLDVDTTRAQRCNCLKQRLIDQGYALSNVRDVLARENFATFKINHFSQEKIENEGLSPRDNMKAVRKIAERFVKSFKPGTENLLFYGTTGLGKTFVCHCIAKALLDAGHTVLYVTAPRLFKWVQTQQFSRDGTEEVEGQLDAVAEADLLILDDLGAEFSTIVTDSALFDVINQRLLDGRSTVISTNLTTDELEEQYTERIVSRLKGFYKMLKFFGEDIRVKKKHQNMAD
ncbi:MAG: ATP-binding protein [Defluviitaleaceae bacterium]|nr:ATP-binding protein [Defluviitaleaceae bacterium]MCL2239611.1 ATP-binding protein [Defluviitaleaceae bacterium]